MVLHSIPWLFAGLTLPSFGGHIQLRLDLLYLLIYFLICLLTKLIGIVQERHVEQFLFVKQYFFVIYNLVILNSGEHFIKNADEILLRHLPLVLVLLYHCLHLVSQEFDVVHFVFLDLRAWLLLILYLLVQEQSLALDLRPEFSTAVLVKFLQILTLLFGYCQPTRYIVVKLEAPLIPWAREALHLVRETQEILLNHPFNNTVLLLTLKLLLGEVLLDQGSHLLQLLHPQLSHIVVCLLLLLHHLLCKV